MNGNLRKTIDEGNSSKLRERLLRESFSDEQIEDAIRYGKQKKNVSILDMNSGTTDETYAEMTTMLSDYQKSKELESKLPSELFQQVQGYLFGGKKAKQTKKRRVGNKNTKKHRRHVKSSKGKKL